MITRYYKKRKAPSSAAAPAAKRRYVARVGKQMSWLVSFGAIAPPIMKTKLQYCDQNYLDVPASTESTDEFIFALNGVFDPNVSGAGTQPRGFDQWHALYTKHLVTACLVEFMPSSNTTARMVAGFYPSSIVTEASGSPDAIARADKMMVLAGSTGGLAAVKLTRYYPMDKLFGQRITTESDEHCGSATANAASLQYLHLFGAHGSVTDATNIAIDYTVKLVYYVTFFNPIRLAES